LFKDYTQRLLDDREIDVLENATVHARVLKLAELETLCEDRRAAALRGEPVDLANLVRPKRIARRIRRSLDLDGSDGL
jgi:hypothetical protein